MVDSGCAVAPPIEDAVIASNQVIESEWCLRAESLTSRSKPGSGHRIELLELAVELFLRRGHAEGGTQDPTRFFLHRPPVVGGAKPQLPFQFVVEAANKKRGHGAGKVGGSRIDINDIIDIKGWRILAQYA
jgi:hypothetical protein